MRRVVFLDHFDAGAAVLGDLVDVGTLHKAQADVCMPQAVRRTRSAFAVEPKIFLIDDGFEKLALPLRNNEVGGSGRAPFFTKDSRVSDVFVGRVHARRAEPAFESAASASSAIPALLASA